jgi:uncharacterized membrane protein
MARNSVPRASERRTNLWVPPVVGSALAGLIAAGALLFDAFTDIFIPVLVFQGTADTARLVLHIIASSVVTLLALIFTVIAVVIQLASGTYSARILTTLLADRPSHFTIGVFVGTFTYALIILMGFDIAVAEDGTTASGVSVTVAFVLAVITIGTFAVYANHIIHAVRVSSLVKLVGKRTHEALLHLYPEPFSSSAEERSGVPEHEPDSVTPSPAPGVIHDFDVQSLVEEAKRRDVLVVVPEAGAFMPAGAMLLEIYGGDGAGLADHVKLSEDRSLRRDVTYGLRQLADIALRATSTGVNDPATALQALDHQHNLLRSLVQRDLSHRVYRDDEGVARVVEKTTDWAGFLRIGVEEILPSAGSSPQVARRLGWMLADLADAAPPERRGIVDRLRQQLDRVIDRSYEDESARALARQHDARGTGF